MAPFIEEMTIVMFKFQVLNDVYFIIILSTADICNWNLFQIMHEVLLVYLSALNSCEVICKAKTAIISNQ